MAEQKAGTGAKWKRWMSSVSPRSLGRGQCGTVYSIGSSAEDKTDEGRNEDVSDGDYTLYGKSWIDKHAASTGTTAVCCREKITFDTGMSRLGDFSPPVLNSA